MTTAPLEHTDVIVLDYLAALWAESEDLAPELRDELMTTVADYIAMRRTSPSSPITDPAEILRRLGPPEALVAATRRGYLPPHLKLPALIPPPPPAATGGGAAVGGAAEYTAIGLMTAGAFVMPGVGPFAGMLMASASPRWTPAEKATGWFLTIGSGTAAFAAGLFFLMLGTANSAGLLFCYMVAVGGSMFAGMRMLDALRRP
ncbi:HAAS signaling domain-containing protein [Paractinoplanes brasiliensis]|uniref:Uncharacterized protein n=1 Tax=Paractinoplanes brasiliensis TaxID=52695 RepID=A0A4R6J8I9_9ACTN|nr:hypothetical protein [Actinoplanes brasiliensis]TDO31201.1 hypothetical protein C8E87_6613 [Actinoplanes brasiliensis]GID28483.1 hypothetical protein Abr02nite_34660 [Actinoplanes brasiliensis]